MINVSNEFHKLMNERTDFKQNAEIIFRNGVIYQLTENDFTVSNNNIVDASETNGIPLGVAVCRSIQIELINDDDRFSDYDFLGAKIRLYSSFQLSESIEFIQHGTFTVLTPETYGTTVIITALDDMYKADKDYSTSLVFPATVKSVLTDACNTLGIVLGTTSFLNDTFVVQSAPTDITFRQLIGYIAMIAGGNARIDTLGRLRIISYDFTKLAEVTNFINGGTFSPWNNPTDLDGGTFAPWNDGDDADGGLFTDRNDFHILSNWSNIKVDTDDVVITGVQTTYTDSDNVEHTVINGVSGYVLSVENPLFAGNEQYAVDLIGNVMVGGTFRQFSGDLVANPTIEFMDNALIIDRKGNMYASFVTDIDFKFFGFTSVKNSAEPTLRNSAKPYSQATQTLVEAKKLVENEKKAREVAVAQLANDLQNSSGLFMTKEEQLDGSIIYYMHDKPTLSESMIVWKLTALAFAVSTDGGKTYSYGFTVDGTTITRLLYAEGINADYIDTGAIRVNDNKGNTIFLADYDTKQVYINADNVMIGSGNVQSYINSMISASTDEIRLEVTERTSVYNEQINSLQGGMDGSIDLTFFDPTTDAEVTTMAGKQCIFAEGISQDMSLPAGTYKFSYEWLRTIGLYTYADIYLYEPTTDYIVNNIYEAHLGEAWPETDVWHKESFQFTLEKTTRLRFLFVFTPYLDRVNDCYLTNIALYGTAQSVADAVADVKAELMLQSDQIALKVSKGNIISEINQTAENITISANKIDLVGLVNAQEFVSKYATITELDVNTANLEFLISQKATIDELDVTTANLEYLIGQKANITDLNATNAAIENLSATKLEASQFTADTISAMNIRVNGANVIGTLSANKISAGSVTINGNNINSSWTAKEVVVGEAQRTTVNGYLTDIQLKKEWLYFLGQ